MRYYHCGTNLKVRFARDSDVVYELKNVTLSVFKKIVFDAFQAGDVNAAYRVAYITLQWLYRAADYKTCDNTRENF